MKRSLGILLFLTGLFLAPLILGRGFVANVDVYEYAAPFRAWGVLEMTRGHLPLWNPWIFAGTPFLASPQSALFYPFTGLFGFLPLAPAFRFFTVGHFFLMALGFYLWTRGRRASHAGALAGAVVGTFSFFFLSKITAGHLIHLSGYAWTPYVLLLGDALKKNPRHRFWPWAWAAASALQFFSGHLQVWVVSHLVLGVLLMDRRLWTWDQLRGWGKAVTAASAGVAVQAFPTAAYLPHTTRAVNTLLSPQDQYAFATSYSLQGWTLLRGWLTPWAWGRPPHLGRLFPDPFSIYLETAAVFMGWVGLGAAAVGLVLLARQRAKRFLGLLLGSLALGFGKNGFIYPWLWKSLAWLRVPARFYLGLHVAAVAGVARAWDLLSRRWRLIFLGLLVVELWVTGRSFVRTEDPGPRFTRTSFIEWFQGRLGEGRLFTTQSVGAHNKGMMFGLGNVNGYEALVPAGLWAAVAGTQPGIVQPTTGVEIDHVPENLFTALGVRYVLGTPALKTSWPRVAASGNLEVRENPAYAGVVRASGGAVLTSLRIRPDRFLCRWRLGSDRLQVVWSEAWFPGWRAWTRRGPLPSTPLGGLIQSVEWAPAVAEGALWWLYRPKPFMAGLWVTLAAGLTGGFFLCRGFRGGRR